MDYRYQRESFMDYRDQENPSWITGTKRIFPGLQVPKRILHGLQGLERILHGLQGLERILHGLQILKRILHRLQGPRESFMDYRD